MATFLGPWEPPVSWRVPYKEMPNFGIGETGLHRPVLPILQDKITTS